MHLLIFSHHWEYFSLHKGVNDRVRWPVLLTISINLMYSTFLPVPHTETVISFDGVCYLFYSFTLTGNLVNQLNRFVLSFWKKKKTLHDFRSYYERERGGRKRGRENLLEFARPPLHMAIIQARCTGGKISGDILQSKCLCNVEKYYCIELFISILSFLPSCKSRLKVRTATTMFKYATTTFT